MTFPAPGVSSAADAGGSSAAGWGAQEQTERSGWTRGIGGQALAAVVVLAVGVVVGVAAALLWRAVADHVRILITANGPDLVSYETNEFFSADGVYTWLGLGFGLVLGVGAYAWRRQRGALVLLGVVAGALIGGLICWRLGRHIGLAHYHQLLKSTQVGQRFDKPVDLRSTIALVVWPLGAVIGYCLPALLSGAQDLDEHA